MIVISAYIRGGESLGEIPGVLLSNNSTWTEVRRSSLHILRDLGYGKNILEDIIDEEIDELMEHIDNQWNDTPVDVGDGFFNVSVVASLWRIISGERLRIDDPKLKKLLANLNKFTKEVANPVLQVSFDSAWFFKFIHKIGITSFLNIIWTTLDYCNEYIEVHKAKSIDGDNPLTFIEAFLHKIQTTQDKNHPLYGERGILNLKNTLFDLFLAGSDTTSAALNWGMLYMILNPEVQDKVRQELKANIGSRKPKVSDRSQTPFTEAVIHEIQRKGNIAPIGVFHRNDKIIDIGPYQIPNDTMIVTTLGEIHNDPDYFPQPQKFDPQRYLSLDDDNNLKFTPHPRVVPFGMGKRRCLGENLARMSLYKFFTSIIQRYEIVNGQEFTPRDEYFPGLVLVPQPYKLKFKKLDH